MQPKGIMVTIRTGGEELLCIYEKAAGHPFFSEELAYALRDAGVIRVTEGACQVVPDAGDFRTVPFPETLEGVITSRFDRLPPVHQLLLKVASVIGPVVPVALLQAISPIALEAAHMADILAALDQVGFLLPEYDTHEGVYRLKHTLTHEVVYNLLPLAQRRPLHRDVAVWYERAHTNDLALFSPLLAHHYTEAGLPEQAIPYWQQAGHHASERSAHLEAISHLTKGIELLKTLPETPMHIQQALHLHIALGTALQMAKGLAAPEVEHAYDQARALCQQVGETSQQVQVLLGVWRYYLARAQLHTARELGDTLLRLAHQTRDPAHAVVAHYALGVTQLNCGVLPAARRHLEEGIVHYASDQSRPPVFRMGQELGVGCHVYAAVTRWLLGYPAQALARLHEALALAHELAHPYSLGLVWCYAAIIAQWRRDVSAVYEQAEAVVALSLEQGFPQWVALGMSLRGWALAMQGQGDEGIAQVRQGIAVYRATGAALGGALLLHLTGRGCCPPGPPARWSPGAGRGPHAGGAACGTLRRSGSLPPVGHLPPEAAGDVPGGSGSLVAAGPRCRSATEGENARAAGGNEPEPPVAAAAQAGPSA